MSWIASLISFSLLLRWVSYDGHQSWFKIELFSHVLGFPDSSSGKESTCNAGDPGLILGLGRSAGEGIGYPLQYCWASLVAHLIENPFFTSFDPWVQSLGWDHSLEKEKATHSSILAWRIPWTEEPGSLQSIGSQRVRHDRATFTHMFYCQWNHSISSHGLQWCSLVLSQPNIFFF